MDVTCAWVDLSQAVSDDDWHKAAEIAENILEWLARDGFPPIITGNRAFDIIAARETCEAIAAWEIA